MADLKGSLFTSILPSFLASQPDVKAIAYAVSRQIEKARKYADLAQILCDMDNMPDWVLDYLALEMRALPYNETWPRETKCRLIKDILLIYIQLGTPAAVNHLIEDVYGGGAIEEWFDYGGNPYYFGVYIDITNNPMVAYSAEEVGRTIAGTKRVSAWLQRVSFMVRHAIILSHTIQAYLYRVPFCGTLYCGTWWMPSTLGWSVKQKLKLIAKPEAFAVSPELSGTLPDTATPGYSVRGTLRLGTLADAYAVEHGAAGEDERSGVLPVISTLGRSERVGQTVSGNVGAFAIDPEFAGTLPDAATLGYAMRFRQYAAGAAGAYLTSPELSGTLPFTSNPAYSVCGALRLGESTRATLLTPANSDTAAGTMPTLSQIGYSARAGQTVTGQSAAFTASPKECGTLPEEG